MEGAMLCHSQCISETRMDRQQFIIRYGQLGINLPFMEEPWKPSPPLVPGSVILLMIVILLVLPQGLFGRSE